VTAEVRATRVLPNDRLDAGDRVSERAVGKLFETIEPKLREWIAAQRLFFVATAPLLATGHVNLSPKGPIGSLRVVDDTTIAYLDVLGSGAETIAHLRENGRIVVMLCAFEGPPRIVRFHGRGEVVLASDARFDGLVAQCAFEPPAFPEARRAVIVVHVERIADSCGYGVPRMKYQAERTQMADWCDRKLREGGAEALVEYRRKKNATSLDGLPAIDLDAPKDPIATPKRTSKRTPKRA
jgi:predicted pyridoxine 5'-phosphate oxidase superfamily flavin-nucleotide-binding protein